MLVGYLRRPFDAAGLRITTIGSESSVVCLPADHPLAGLVTRTPP